MANKTISELTEATSVNEQDLFVLEQSGLAKKMTAETFITAQNLVTALATALAGHGGISSVTLSSVSGRIRTYLITFTDATTTTFQVYDGTTIERIAKTSEAGLVSTYTIFMSDGTTTFFTVHNGADGDVSEATLNSELAKKAPVIAETVSSTAVATFADGADNMPIQSLVAEFEPIQDLTYGDPYPAGSGKNLFDSSIMSDVNTTNKTADIALSPNTTYTVSTNLPKNNNDSANFFAYNSNGSPITSGTGLWSGQTRTVTTNSDGIIRILYRSTDFSDTSATYYLSFHFQIELGSTATSYAPYSNICPITGHTEVNVTRTGKNLLPNLTYATGNLRLLGVSSDSFTIYLKAGISYTFSRNTAVSCGAYMQGSSDSSSTMLFSSATASGVASKTFTVSYDGLYKIWLYKSGGGVAESDISYFQLEVGSSATDYEEYKGSSTATLSWQTEAGTVYGGTIDVATGLLTVTQISVNFGDLSWTRSGTNTTGKYRFTSALEQTPAVADLSNETALCDRVPLIAAGQTYFCNDGFTIANGRLYVFLSDYSSLSVDDFKTAVTGTQLVYTLATSQTYLLTPQQLMTLLGTNNVWSDLGDVTVTYPADTKMFIENLTQPTEDDMTANQAITSGKYFMIGNSLYLALANIASGAQITIGTNAQRVSLADALNAINS